MKLLLPILALLAFTGLALADDPEQPPEHPHFLVWRDKGRLHLLTESLSSDITIGGTDNAGEEPDCSPETYFRENRAGFEFHRFVSIDGGLARFRFFQDRDGSVTAEWWTDLSADRIARRYPDLSTAFRDADVCRAICGALKDAGQNSEIPTLPRLKAALGWNPMPDLDTHRAIMRLIEDLDDRDPKVRRLACVELHSLAMYLPAVIKAEQPELDAEQAARINWALSDNWVSGTGALIWLAQDIFLDE